MDCCSPLLDYIVPLGAAALSGLLFYLLGKKRTENLETELYEAEEKQLALTADMERTSMHYRTLENKVSVADFKYNTLEKSFAFYKEEAEKELAAQKAIMNNTILLLRNDLERVKSEHAVKLAEAEKGAASQQNDSQAKLVEAEKSIIMLKNEHIEALAEAEKRIVLVQNESATKIADAEQRITTIQSEFQTNAQSITGVQEGLSATLTETKRALGEAQSRYTLMLHDRDTILREKSALNSQIANLKIDVEGERRRYATLLSERDRLITEKEQLSVSIGSNQTGMNVERQRLAHIEANYSTAQTRIHELEIELANILIDLHAERTRYRVLIGERDMLLTERSNSYVSGNSKTTTIITPLIPIQTVPDDLEIIEGIGAKIEQILYDAGIKTFHQLAQTRVEILRGILNKAGNRFRMHNPSTWAQQAALAAEGKWAELDKLKAELVGGKVSA